MKDNSIIQSMLSRPELYWNIQHPKILKQQKFLIYTILGYTKYKNIYLVIGQNSINLILVDL